MVLRCAWGTCNTDERYPERLVNVKFYRFPNPKHDLEKCLRWIKACCRPHEQLNISRLNKHKAICSKHFYGGFGPTKEFPDPLSADSFPCTPARRLPSKETASSAIHKPGKKSRKVVVCRNTTVTSTCTEERSLYVHVPLPIYVPIEEPETGVYTQTEESWTEPIDVLALAAENEGLKKRVACLESEVVHLKELVKEKDERLKKQTEQLTKSATLSINFVQKQESRLKNLFTFYTGIAYVRFLDLLSYLVPSSHQIDYKCKHADLKTFQNNDGLFLTLCRLRHAFKLKDIAARFGLSFQSAGIVFNTWLDCMFFKFCQLSIWPHRDTIINRMPEDFKRDFPTSLIIIDETEVKTHVPKAMQLHSQLDSNSNPPIKLKCLIGCDPMGKLMFVSELFPCTVSDKTLIAKSEFYETIQILKSNGYIQEGDAVMIDKGFDIKKKVNELGLVLNTPLSAASGSEMSISDTDVTQDRAKNRVQRLIRKVKMYKIVSKCMPSALYHSKNKVWSVCCYMTLYEDVLVKNEPE